jgi:hypothetical protein
LTTQREKKKEMQFQAAIDQYFTGKQSPVTEEEKQDEEAKTNM